MWENESMPPGEVRHWTDNEAVVMGMAAIGGARIREWRDKKSRDLWGEVITLVRLWREGGGTWRTDWVEGHVDGPQSGRERETWSLAERWNVEADAIATAELEDPRGWL